MRTVNLLQHCIVPITRLDILTTFYETTKNYVRIMFRVWLKHIQTRKYELLLGLPPCKRLFWLIYSVDSNESFTCVTWPVFACTMSFETSVVKFQDLRKRKSQFSKLKNDKSNFSVIAPKLESIINAYQ